MKATIFTQILPDVNNRFFYQKFIFKDVGGEGDGRNADLVFAEAEDSNRVESIHVPQPGNLSLFSHELL